MASTEQELLITEKDTAPVEKKLAIVPTQPILMSFRHSTSIAKLCEALAKAAAEFPEIAKDTENPYFRSQYADLATLIKGTRPVLAKHGLCVVQAPQTYVNAAMVTTMLMHSSGEWLANDLQLPSSKPDAQGLGSAITYGRRYSYQAILNIAGEEDDDGNAAVGRSQADRKSVATESGSGRINPVQVRAFNSACKTGNKSEKQILDYMGRLGHESTDELEKSELEDAIKWALAK